ncbi:hypothetical protein VH96_07340 [Acinetobacter indicus]|nr:hypothetical protein VH96_07340 [Acinetobacter indicus]
MIFLKNVLKNEYNQFWLCLFQDEISGKKLNEKIIKNRSVRMLQLLKNFFCLHIYEYEQMEEIGAHIECRKCGANKS